MTVPAYIYARYSSQEQGKGTSLKRQIEGARDFIQSHTDWEYPQKDAQAQRERDFTDLGKSAYSGAHRAPGGSLYEFERKAAAGHFRNGAVLVVENLDRLTREGWKEALSILETLTANGVTVATIHGSKMWRAGEKPEMGQVITVIVEAESDHRASDDKSKRLKKAWTTKIAAIEAGDKTAYSKILPAWLEVDPETKAARAIPHRADLVREIFEKYVEGLGLPAIVRMINERGEPSWAYGKKNKGNGWNTAYLHKLLKNRAVLGEYAPKSRRHGAAPSEAVSKGVLVPDYYPQVVTADLFNKAQTTKKSRQFTGGAEESKLRNLFAGIASCAECGGKMYYQLEQRPGRVTVHKSKTDRTKRTYICRTARSSFRCNNNRRGHQCSNNTRIRYEYLETAVLDALLTSALDSRDFALPDRVAEIENQIAEHERMIAGREHKLANVTEALAERFSKAVANKAGELEDEIDAERHTVEALREELITARGNASPDEHIARVREVRGSLDAEDPDERFAARMKVHQAMRHIIVQMTCYPDRSVYVHTALYGIRIDSDRKVSIIDVVEQAKQHRDELPGEALAQLQRIEANAP